jgi:hypothetical protein
MTDWTDKSLLELIKLAATPIDFDQLITDVVLRKHGRRYELLDLARLPENAGRKIRIATTSSKTANPVVSIYKLSKQVVREAKKRGCYRESALPDRLGHGRNRDCRARLRGDTGGGG